MMKYFFSLCFTILICSSAFSEEQKDDVFISRKNYTKKQDDEILRRFNNLNKSERVCADKFLQNYQDNIFNDCNKKGYGDDIGGGCYHIVNYSLHTAVFHEGLKKCSEFGFQLK